jgi:hypothetical protein
MFMIVQGQYHCSFYVNDIAETILQFKNIHDIAGTISMKLLDVYDISGTISLDFQDEQI